MRKRIHFSDKANIPVLILCGGRGTRMGSEDLPKPMVKIGEQPILWHIMKLYESFGYKHFILLLGYKKSKIENYFKKYKEWKIEFVYTGLKTNTGGRIKKAERFVKSDIFFVTYGDGLSNLNIQRLVNFHLKHKKTATLTSVRPFSQFGIISIDSHTNIVTHFKEKPLLDHWVNGGFFVFNRKVFKYINEDDVLEKKPLIKLAKSRALSAYKHRGFWKCMDTYKDNLLLNQLWNSGNAPWAVWHKERT